MSDRLADWTKGAEAIVYQSCSACGNVQFAVVDFERD